MSPDNKKNTSGGRKAPSFVNPMDSQVGEADGTLYEEVKQDVGPSLRNVKTLRQLHGGRVHPDAYLAMELPHAVFQAWLRKRGVTLAQFQRDNKLRKELINDPDLAAFRVWKGRV